MRVQTKKHRQDQQLSRRSRVAFTLVELMIVLVIIAILMGFLFPAISNVLDSAQNATVVTEIKDLEGAIAQFKLKYGVEPPSSIILYERTVLNGAPHWSDDTTSDLSGLPATQARRDLRRRQSLAFIRQVWPNFVFDLPRDFNGDGDADDYLVLKGAECLLFFLGGMSATEDGAGNSIINANGGVGTPGPPGKWVPLGFSTNPQNPFARGGNRVAPFIDFDPSRIVDVSDSAFRSMPEYLDSLPGQIAPYLYVNSNAGRGYQKVFDGDGHIARYVDLDLDSSAVRSPTFIYVLQNGSLDGDGGMDPNAIPHNKSSFQIISAGQDQQYGLGGLYDREDGFSDLGFNAEVQKDNITNFAGAVLDPS